MEGPFYTNFFFKMKFKECFISWCWSHTLDPIETTKDRNEKSLPQTGLDPGFHSAQLCGFRAALHGWVKGHANLEYLMNSTFWIQILGNIVQSIFLVLIILYKLKYLKYYHRSCDIIPPTGEPCKRTPAAPCPSLREPTLAEPMLSTLPPPKFVPPPSVAMLPVPRACVVPCTVCQFSPVGQRSPVCSPVCQCSPVGQRSPVCSPVCQCSPVGQRSPVCSRPSVSV